MHLFTESVSSTTRPVRAAPSRRVRDRFAAAASLSRTELRRIVADMVD